jgi:replicative DNA helicase
MLQSWMKREAIRVGMEAVSKGYDDTEDALDLISDIQSQLLSVSGVLNIRHAKSSSDGMEDYMKQILTPRENNLSGVDTGYSHFNKFTGGWQRSDVYVIAARPGVGKTAFGLNFAWRCAAIGNAKALFCSLEMPDYQIKTRLLSMVSTCTYQNIQNQYYTAWEKEQIQNHGYRAFPKDLWLDDTPALTPSQLRSKIIHMRSKVGCDIVFVDYLQLMTDGKKQGPFTNREQEVSSISRQLKAIAMEFNIPIVAMAQLNRESTKRAGGKPLLSDLRESGSIEQDASTVMFPWNPHENKVDKENGEPYDPNTVFMLVQKHRNGALDDVPFYVVKRTSRVLMPGEDSKNIFHVNHEENDNRDEGF